MRTIRGLSAVSAFASFFCFLVPPGNPAANGEPPKAAEHRWVILIEGRPVGVQTFQVNENGEQVYTYEYNDRGRGPKLETRLTLGEKGIPTHIDTTGQDYFKVPVEEAFELRGKLARWKNTAEEGQKSLEGPAFYLSKEKAHPELGLLAEALLRTPARGLPLLPEGEARLQVLGRHKVEAECRTRTLTHVSVSGLNFLPDTVWLDEDGGFFAQNFSWFTLIPPGWESARDTLLAADRKQRAEWLAELGRRLPHRAENGIAFTGAALFDSQAGRVSPNTTVVVMGERIHAVGPDREVKIPAGVETIDARDKMLLPGLWDMHAHVDDIDGILHIAAGVTTVRDLANDIDKVQALKRAWEAGEAIGPRLILAGFMDGPGPFAGPTKILVDTEDETRRVIDHYADLGYEQIKIYSSLEPSLVPVAIQQAHKRGLRVSGHIPNGMSAEEAVRLGVDEIQHANMLFLNFWAREGLDTRTPVRFTAVAERAASLDLDSAEVQSLVRLLKERQTVIDPTVAIFETMFTAPPGGLGANFAAIPYQLPVQVRRGFWGGGLKPPEGKTDTYKKSHAAMLRLVGKLYEAGVPLVAGTDDLAGFTLHRELELYVKAGIPAPQVLQLATLGAARLVKRDDRLGSIEPGKLADLILVDGNPVDHISDIRRVELIVRGGVLYRSKELYQAIGVQSPPRQPVTPEDFHSLTWVGDPQWSPVDDRIVFTTSHSNEKRDAYDSNLWVIHSDGSGLRQLTHHPAADHSPRWSKDGHEILLLSERGGSAQAWILPVDGGEAWCVTPFQLEVSSVRWIPGSRAISFLARVPPDGSAGRKKTEEMRKPRNAELEKGVRVIQQTIYRAGKSYSGGLRPHLFTLELASGEVRQLTAGEVSVADYSWSADGSRVAVRFNHLGDASDVELSRVVVLGRDGAIERALNEHPRYLTGPVWRPETAEILLAEEDPRGFNDKVFLVDSLKSTGRQLSTGFDGDFSTWGWSRDGSQLFALAEERGEVHVWSLEPDSGRARRLTRGRRQLGLHSQMFAAPGFSLSPDATHFVAAQTTSDQPEELVLGTTRGGSLRSLTDLNREWRATRRLVRAHKFAFGAGDGAELEAWTIPPAELKPGEKRPLILEIHGGPRTMYGEHFMQEFQILAGMNYGVLYVNPRGSTGYGEASKRATLNNWGGTPYGDLMAAVDAAIARYPWVDQDRLGVAGGSYGGFMTAWIIGHTDRFKAAIPMRGVYNFYSFPLTTDIPHFAEVEFGSLLWDNPERYWEFSPLAYANRVKTPTLILHSENDFRAPIPDAEEFYMALRLHGVPTEFVRYQNEGHELSRSGRPDRRVDRLERIAVWFRRWLEPENQSAQSRD
jgi:dipeptidyl aminopeptidase/acylaminoacyl peptidase/imidazolonepropionase-like amidohydrolase